MPQNLGDVLAYLLGFALVLLGWVAVAHAAGTVTTCDEASLNTALSGGGAVDFATGSACTITVTSTKTISVDTTIDGANGGYGTTISGGGTVGIFSVSSTKNFTVEHLTLTNGASTAGGGAILQQDSTLTINECSFTTNSATGGLHGGAVYQLIGTLVVTDSTFGNNTAQGVGGGIAYSGTNGTVVNSTFYGNTATGTGGGVFNYNGAMSITNSTFAANTGSAGGGIKTNLGTLTVTNTIITASTGGNCSGTITNGGNNIDDGTSCGWGSNLGSMSSTDPLLDPAGLASNGGPTQTIALCLGSGNPASCTGASPAINAGDNTTCAASPASGLDQRGYYRPGFGQTNCSIGAFEAYSDVSTPTPTSATTNTPTATPTITDTPTVTATPTVTETPTVTPTETPVPLRCLYVEIDAAGHEVACVSFPEIFGLPTPTP